MVLPIKNIVIPSRFPSMRNLNKLLDCDDPRKWILHFECRTYDAAAELYKTAAHMIALTVVMLYMFLPAQCYHIMFLP